MKAGDRVMITSADMWGAFGVVADVRDDGIVVKIRGLRYLFGACVVEPLPVTR